MRKWSMVFGAALVASVVVVGCGKKAEEPLVQQSETAEAAPTPLPLAPAASNFAEAQLTGPGGAIGVITFTAEPSGVHVVAQVQGAKPGMHGFHLHAGGTCDAPDFKSAGDHFNPAGAAHGAPTAAQHHAGDLGNIEVGADGAGHLDAISAELSVGGGGTNDVVGKTVILHEGQDDLTTQPSGNSGPRIACGVIELTTAPPPTGLAATETPPPARPEPSGNSSRNY